MFVTIVELFCTLFEHMSTAWGPFWREHMGGGHETTLAMFKIHNYYEKTLKCFCSVTEQHMMFENFPIEMHGGLVQGGV